MRLRAGVSLVTVKLGSSAVCYFFYSTLRPSDARYRHYFLEVSVKTALTRQPMFHFTTHRSQTIQRVRLGATPDGMYAAPNRLTTHRVVKLDLPNSDSTRAPGEAVGMLAFEQAMDELAEKPGLDPIELRVRNEPPMDPEKNIPFSTRELLRCMKDGAERFG